MCCCGNLKGATFFSRLPAALRLPAEPFHSCWQSLERHFAARQRSGGKVGDRPSKNLSCRYGSLASPQEMMTSLTSFMSGPCLTCLGGDSIRGSHVPVCFIAVWIAGVSLSKGDARVPAGSPCRCPVLCLATWRFVSKTTAQSLKSFLTLP